MALPAAVVIVVGPCCLSSGFAESFGREGDAVIGLSSCVGFLVLSCGS